MEWNGIHAIILFILLAISIGTCFLFIGEHTAYKMVGVAFSTFSVHL